MLSRGSATRVWIRRSSLFRFEGTAPGPPCGALGLFSSGPAGAACQHLAVALCVSAQTQLLENCIASTSILKIPSYKEPTVDALAPDADEGRGWLR